MDLNATQYLPTPGLIVEEEQEQHWIQFENPSQFDKLLYASFGTVTAGSASSILDQNATVLVGFFFAWCRFEIFWLMWHLSKSWMYFTSGFG